MNDVPRRDFQAIVKAYYQDFGRHDLPWRQPEASGGLDPYKVMVSELMLQQTQVPRVIPKYQEFLARFPDTATLAKAPLGEVLRAWSGLGYNRRAKYLRQAAQTLEDDFKGEFPRSVRALQTLPGIGAGTAGAIMAYAFNQPVVFIETNIRTVYIHHFFADQTDIADKAIIELVSQTLDSDNPREWYWALMDYGSYLKQTIGNLNRQSKSYAKQSAFQGSRRQIRGQVLRLLGAQPQTKRQLRAQITDERFDAVLAELTTEKMIQKKAGRYHL